MAGFLSGAAGSACCHPLGAGRTLCHSDLAQGLPCPLGGAVSAGKGLELAPGGVWDVGSWERGTVGLKIKPN